MNKVDYNQPGGFPFSTQILDAAQEAYKTFNAYGNYAGDLAIIAGCELGGGGNVNSGFVSIYGELLPFVGGNISSDVAIVETTDQRGFEDGSVKPVIYTRYATFGAATVSYPWSNFRRPLTLFQLEDRLLQLEKSVPINLVALWDQPAEGIPIGWVEHIPLRGNVPVGHNAGDVNFGSLGNTIGTTQVTLTESQIPPLNFDYEDISNNNQGGADIGVGYDGGTNGFRRRNLKTNTRGGGQSHTNIQPSRIVKYIRFVGF